MLPKLLILWATYPQFRPGKARRANAVNQYMRLGTNLRPLKREMTADLQNAGMALRRRLQLDVFASWLAEPIKVGDLEIRDHLQLMLVGRTSMLLFGGSGVLSMALSYAILQNLSVGLVLCLLSIVSTIQRILSARPASREPEHIGQNCQWIIMVGLVWTIITSVINVMCVITGQMFLVVLASCVSTGLAFGAAFNNAAAPRFARTQLTIMILPYIVAVAAIAAPHMPWIFAVAPLWMGGTFLVVDRCYRTSAELIHAQQRATFLALNDQLTGLANRSQILTVLHRCCDDLQHANEGELSYVLFLDLDGFKNVNDSYGHGVGDELLCAVANRLTATVGPNDVMGRFGGDEFVAILRGTTPQQVQDVADRMVSRLGEPFDLAAASAVHIGVSIGGTSLASRNVKKVLERADALLYAAKRAGKGTVRLSQQPLEKATGEHPWAGPDWAVS